jgi:hypothetical protein
MDMTFHVNKIPIVAILRIAELKRWERWRCVEESAGFAHRSLIPAETGGGHVDQHEERRAREG